MHRKDDDMFCAWSHFTKRVIARRMDDGHSYHPPTAAETKTDDNVVYLITVDKRKMCVTVVFSVELYKFRSLNAFSTCTDKITVSYVK